MLIFKKYTKNSQYISIFSIFNTISGSVKRSSVTEVTYNNGGYEMIYFKAFQNFSDEICMISRTGMTTIKYDIA